MKSVLKPQQASSSLSGKLINWAILLYSRTAYWYSRRLIHRVSGLFAFTIFACAYNYRRQIVANFAQLFPERPPRALLLLAYRSIRNFARYFADLFYVSAQQQRGINELIGSLEHGERIHKALEQGNGVILATAHLGNWEMGGFLISDRKLPINIVYMKDKFTRMEDHRSRFRELTGVKEIPLGDSTVGALAILRALKRNEIVGLQVDRDVTAKSVPIECCGGRMKMPVGPALLALISGAVILPAFVLFTPELKYRAIIEEPIYARKTEDRDADVQAVLIELARVLERYVRLYPEQWYCFYQVFADHTR